MRIQEVVPLGTEKFEIVNVFALGIAADSPQPLQTIVFFENFIAARTRSGKPAPAWIIECHEVVPSGKEKHGRGNAQIIKMFLHSPNGNTNSEQNGIQN